MTYVIFDFNKLRVLNRYECGIMVLKYLQPWDPMKKYDGKSMSAYTCEDLQ
ncbi:hypothetical protein DEO72_LG4g486 [Vigna unguiculata]|uniref:Ulp1 protease family n=1 Tax=Vigna unguiculata TaxID=3917 RepID=A0A4D6LLX9_VIGUN|nr:hypothetical protein DEO72_LG4g486 [Vigna unguiculata]